MLGFSHDVKIYLCLGHTDMRKGVHGLALLASSLIKDEVKSSNIIVFRGKSADKIKSSREPLYRDSLSHHRTSDVAYGGFAVMFTKS